jgi:predicted  nucleic acid-binding Zn-ribbon protein
VSDVITVSLVSAGVSLAVAILAFIGSRFARKDTKEDKTRDALEARVAKAEERAAVAEVKQEETTTRLYKALEDGRQALIKTDGDCKQQIAATQGQLEQVKNELNELRDFMRAYVRAVRNNVEPGVNLKIRDELDASGVKWPQRL